MSDFTRCRELAPYRRETVAMRKGATGKCGFLELVFELDRNGKSVMRRWDRRAPLIVQQELYFDEGMPEMPCVYILSAGGPNVDGDRYEHRFIMKQGAYAFISTGAATKIAEMVYNFSGLGQTFVLEDETYLEYLPEATIPCENSRYVTDTHITVAPSATLFYAEIYTGGRKYYGKGESFVYDLLSVCTEAHRPDGSPLFREKMVVEPKRRPVGAVGMMHGYEVFADVMVLTPAKEADCIYEQWSPFIDREQGVAVGISYLPNRCGLVFRVLGRDTQPVKRIVRRFASTVRMQVKGHPLPEEFVWK